MSGPTKVRRGLIERKLDNVGLFLCCSLSSHRLSGNYIAIKDTTRDDFV